MSVNTHTKIIYGFSSLNDDDVRLALDFGEGEGPEELYNILDEFEEHHLKFDAQASGNYVLSRFDSMCIGVVIDDITKLTDPSYLENIKQAFDQYVARIKAHLSADVQHDEPLAHKVEYYI